MATKLTYAALIYTALGGLTLTLAGCVYQPVPVAPPPPVAYYAAPGYYAEPVYPAYGYYGGPRVDLNIGRGYGRGYEGGRWR